MAKNKFYAVRIGKEPGIYRTWSETEIQVKGFPSADYKAFQTHEEAERYLLRTEIKDEGSNGGTTGSEKLQDIVGGLGEKEAIAIVYGKESSDNNENKKLGFGGIVITSSNKMSINKAYVNHHDAESGCIVAEIEAFKEAVLCAVGNNISKLTVFYNSEGIEKWAVEEWKAKKSFAKDYVSFYREKSKLINIEFQSCKPYKDTDLYYEVCGLAELSLLKKGHKTYSDGSIYFTGYNIEDWIRILSEIKDEVKDTTGNDALKYDLIKGKDSKNVIEVRLYRDSLKISCYKGNKSYVQGKQSILLEKIVTVAIEGLGDKNEVIETLNKYRLLTIEKTDLEIRLSELIPHFPIDTKDNKHYNNILTAVYNTMLVGYMPDYTSLLHPVFRASEFFLHRILGDQLKLETQDDNGKNKFSYFNKDCKTKLYYFNKKNTMEMNRLNLLNDLYNYYNRIRHPCSHWAKQSVDTKVYTDMNEVRELILEAFILFEKYYIIF